MIARALAAALLTLALGGAAVAGPNVALDNILMSKVNGITKVEIWPGCTMRYVDHSPKDAGLELRIRVFVDPDCAELLDGVNSAPRVWQLEVSSAGGRQEAPEGFEQAVPGMLVMFTLLVLLTSGATMLVQERTLGLLRRLASAPITRAEVIAGKWQGRMVLAAIQVTVALLFGTFLFSMDWGPNLPAVIVVLIAWAGFCASAGLWLGTLAQTEAQASGLGVLVSCLLAALGGCWWPIEVTPDWMQLVQKATPTGWTMDALHKLISFQAEASTVIPNVLVLLVAAAALGALAARRFEYQ